MTGPRSPSQIADCLRAASCSSEEAATWLAGRTVEYSTVWGVPDTPSGAHLPEYILCRRQVPRIDVALAQHGRSRTVLRRLYRRAGPGLRAVLAANGSLFVGKDVGSGIPFRDREAGRNFLWDIVRDAPLAELRALCANPDIESGFYSALIEAWKPDGTSHVDEARFRQIVGFLAENARVSQSREDSRERHYLDGYSDYTYNKFYTGAWRLAAVVPVTPAWADVLGRLYRNLHRPFDCLDDVEAVLARWRVSVGEYDSDFYRDLRANVARAFVKPSLDELRHDDPARRDAFLMTFDPEAREFRDLDWSEFIALDRYWSLSLRQNMKVWASPRARGDFRRLLWKASEADSDVTGVGFYDAQKEELEQVHPEWFVDEDDDEDFEEPVIDPIDRVRAEIGRLNEAVDRRNGTHLVGAGLFVAGLLLGHWI